MQGSILAVSDAPGLTLGGGVTPPESEETKVSDPEGPTPSPPSRISPPAIPPRNERGADAIAFGVLKADGNKGPTHGSDPISEADKVSDPEGLTPASDEDDTDNENDDDIIADELPDRPDLMLIDGGLGQLGVAREVAAELGVTDVVLIGVAKGPDRDAGREHFHLSGRERPMMLEPRDPVLYFVQRLRDEAHRFAIGTHRAKRSKAMSANPLDEIAGIGPTRKSALMKHFGSAKAVSRASVEDMLAVPGISADLARKVYDFFHEKG